MISTVDLLLLMGILLPRRALNTTKHSKHFPAGIQTLRTMGSRHFSDTFHCQALTNNYIHIRYSFDWFIDILCTASLSSFIKLLKCPNRSRYFVCAGWLKRFQVDCILCHRWDVRSSELYCYFDLVGYSTATVIDRDM